jgi:putative membrane protein
MRRRSIVSSNRKRCSAANATRLSAIGGLALVIAACGSRQPPPAPLPRPSIVLPSAAASLSPALYVSLIGNISLFAVRASEILLERSADARTRDAARQVIDGQKGVAAQLSMAGRRVDLLPDAALTAQMNADLERLRTSTAPEADYRALMIKALSRGSAAHETFARAGTSPTLRPVAQMAAPVTRRNLDAVRGR